MNDEKIDALITALGNKKDWIVNQRASKELVEIGLPAVQKLQEALLSSNDVVNTAAGIVLAKIAPPGIVPLLTQACKNEDWHVRKAAVFSLGIVGDKAALSTILEILENDDHAYVRGAAADAAGMIRDVSAIPALVNALRNRNNKWVYSLAGAALASIGEPALPTLLDALCDNTIENHEAIQFALTSIGRPAVPGLLKLLTREDLEWYVRPKVVGILGEIGDEAAIPSFKQLLFGNDKELSDRVYDVLENMGTSEAEQILDEWWSHQ